MRMFKILLFIFCFVFSLKASAQEAIGGYVWESTKNNPIEFASIVISNEADSTLLSSTFTNEKGYFSFVLSPTIRLENVHLSINALGYEPIKNAKLINDSSAIYLMKAKTTTLDEVVVSAYQNSYTINGKNLIFNPQVLGNLTGKDATYVLNYVPKVSVFGSEFYVGNTLASIYINDRLLSEQEVAAYLSSLDAENISTIEVQDMRSSEYAGNITGGIIKIFTKTKPLGLSSSIGLNIGARKPGYWTINPNTTFYFGKESWNIYGSYAFDNAKTGQTNSVLSIYPDHSSYKNVGIGTYYSQNHIFKIGSFLNYSHKHIFNIELYGMADSNPQLMTDVNHFDKTTSSNENITNGKFISNINFHKLFLGSAFQYKYLIDTIGSFIKALTVYNHNNTDSDNIMTTIYSDNNKDYLEKNLSEANANNFLFKLDAYKKFRSWSLDGGFNYSLTNRKSGIDVFSKNISNTSWISHENIFAAYIGSCYELVPKTTLEISFRIEHTYLKGEIEELNSQQMKRSYFDWLPFIHLSGTIGSIRYGIGYTRQLIRPSFRLMTNYANRVSDWLYDIGNPDLKREISDVAQIAIYYKSNSFLLQYKRTNDPITEVFEDIDDIIYHSNQNIGYNESMSINYGLAQKILPWWRINLNLSMEYAHFPFCYLKHTSWNGMGSISNLFSFKRIGNLNISAKGNTGSIKGNSKRSGYYTINASFTHYYKQWNFTLGINDILNSIKMTTRNYSPTLDYTGEIKNYTRLFFISCSFNFRTDSKVSREKLEFDNTIKNRL